MSATCSAALGSSVASIARLLGVSRSTIYKYVPDLTDGRQPAILEAAPTAPTLPNLTS
jgi:transposase-like protein